MKPKNHNKVDRDFERVLAAVGLPPNHTPHSLRHTNGSLLLVQGESIYYVQRMLGHASSRASGDRMSAICQLEQSNRA